jgi:hypothetical protein
MSRKWRSVKPHYRKRSVQDTPGDFNPLIFPLLHFRFLNLNLTWPWKSRHRATRSVFTLSIYSESCDPLMLIGERSFWGWLENVSAIWHIIC